MQFNNHLFNFNKPIKDFNYKILKNSVKIYSNLFETITQNYESNQVKLVALVKSRYIESLEDLDKRFSHILEDIISFIANIDELQNIDSLIFLHLGVKYDTESDRLIYNRELQLGMGSSLYGLEFAKSLHMDEVFLKNAYRIREKIIGKSSELKTLKAKKRSRYNKALYLTKCALCDEEVEETHHILPQNLANSSGKIGYIDKNHKYNLIPLCKKHHKLVHQGKIVISGFIMTSEGLQLHYNERLLLF